MTQLVSFALLKGASSDVLSLLLAKQQQKKGQKDTNKVLAYSHSARLRTRRTILVAV
jgi:hypothetical protein